MMKITAAMALWGVAILMVFCTTVNAQSAGVNYPATDGLGRELPTHEDVGDLRPDKTVAMFFWTWHSGHSTIGYDYDLTEIITTPDMINDYDHPGWTGYGNVPYFWAEPLYGFYDGKDPWVARKQIEMLGAAGVDALFFDATNGSFTWREGYETLGDAMEEARADGVDVPQFAFMLNFGAIPETARSLADLYENMYGIGLYEDSWFRWEGKPVVMAYSEAVGTPGSTAGMHFTASQAFTGVNVTCPSWANDIGDLTLSLYAWTGNYNESVTHSPLAREAFVDYADNAKLALEFAQLPAGEYVWQLTAARELVGAWRYDQETAGVDSYFDGAVVSGDYESEIKVDESWTPLTTGSSHTPVVVEPAVINSQPGETAGMKFTASGSFTGVDAHCPSWGSTKSDLTFSLYAWTGDYAGSVAQPPLASETFENYADNTRLRMEFAAQPAGDYVWELSQGADTAGVWKFDDETAGVDSYFNGSPTSGDYNSQIKISGSWSALTSGSSVSAIGLDPGLSDVTLAAVLDFFTFRPGQPAYNTGPSRNDQWGWLENYPQHGYVEKSPGEYEFMTVGIAQNWSAQTNALSAMNGPLVHGRSYTYTNQFDDLTSTSYLYGYNFQEQWDRALTVDPDIVFITGWNEWVAGRYDTWMGVENAFPDQYSPEYSRDIEPARGFTKDHYYYQMIANIRRFKGMDAPDEATPDQWITIDGSFDDWVGLSPRFADSKGDVLLRDGYGYADQTAPVRTPLHYTNTTARNDIVSVSVAENWKFVYFYVETADALTNYDDPNWMLLLIDVDLDKATGWEGYEWMVGDYTGENTASLKTSAGTWNWTPTGQIEYRVSGNKMELAIPRSMLELEYDDRIILDFKWLDSPTASGDIMEVYTDGEAAPDGRFSYRFKEFHINAADASWLDQP